MNNTSRTVDLKDIPPVVDIPATGFWSENYTGQTLYIWSMSRIAKIVGLVLSLAASPVTALPDTWLMESKRRETVVTMRIFRQVIGQAISRSEALHIASQILEKAERERLAFAEYEAARGIEWGGRYDL